MPSIDSGAKDETSRPTGLGSANSVTRADGATADSMQLGLLPTTCTQHSLPCCCNPRHQPLFIHCRATLLSASFICLSGVAVSEVRQRTAAETGKWRCFEPQKCLPRASDTKWRPQAHQAQHSLGHQAKRRRPRYMRRTQHPDTSRSLLLKFQSQQGV